MRVKKNCKIRDLPTKLRLLAVRRSEEQVPHRPIDETLDYTVSQAFSWIDTEEGLPFWHAVYTGEEIDASWAYEVITNDERSRLLGPYTSLYTENTEEMRKFLAPFSSKAISEQGKTIGIYSNDRFFLQTFNSAPSTFGQVISNQDLISLICQNKTKEEQ